MTRKYWTGQKIEYLESHQFFVFGSNPEARHGAGAAKAACQFGAAKKKGAIPGIAHGFSGQTYAIVTKNLTAGITDSKGRYYAHEGERSVSKEQICEDIDTLFAIARSRPGDEFIITYQYVLTPSGRSVKSLNGYTGLETFEMFYRDDIPANIIFHDSYKMLIEAYQQDLPNKYEFFVSTESPGSQWHPSLFTYKDRTFISCEHFMMYNKAMLFLDFHMAESLLSLTFLSDKEKALVNTWTKGEITCPYTHNGSMWNNIQKQIKEAGRNVSNFNPVIWDQKCDSIVTVGNREKFLQNPTLYAWLEARKNKYFVESASYDAIWGIGIGLEDPRRFYSHLWQGTNRLGNAINRVVNHFFHTLKEDHTLNK